MMRKDIKETLDNMSNTFMKDWATEDLNPRLYQIYVAYESPTSPKKEVIARISHTYHDLDIALKDSDSYNTWLDDNYNDIAKNENDSFIREMLESASTAFNLDKEILSSELKSSLNQSLDKHNLTTYVVPLKGVEV